MDVSFIILCLDNLILLLIHLVEPLSLLFYSLHISSPALCVCCVWTNTFWLTGNVCCRVNQGKIREMSKKKKKVKSESFLHLSNGFQFVKFVSISVAGKMLAFYFFSIWILLEIQNQWDDKVLYQPINLRSWETASEQHRHHCLWWISRVTPGGEK